MKYIRILSYLPAMDEHLLDDIIDEYSWFWRWTWQKEVGGTVDPNLRCSHSEIYFPDTEECYTSTMRDKVNGVVIRPAEQVLDHPERWNYFDIPVSDHEYACIYTEAKMRASLGIKYGKLTIASFFLPWRINEKKADICSEEVESTIQAGLEAIPFRQAYSDTKLLALSLRLRKLNVPSPLRLAANVKACGYELKSLAV